MAKTRGIKAKPATKPAAEPEPVSNELEELKQKNAQLQKQLDVAPMSAPTGQKAINSWVTAGKLIIRQFQFRKTKFIQPDDPDDEDDEKPAQQDGEMAVTEKFYDHKFTKEEQERLGEAHKNLWVPTFSPMVVRAFNATRSQIQTDVRTCYLMGWAAKNLANPKIERKMLRKCMNRTIDLNVPLEKKVFTWYWTELLRKYLEFCLEVGHFFWANTNCRVIFSLFWRVCSFVSFVFAHFCSQGGRGQNLWHHNGDNDNYEGQVPR